MSKKLIIFFLIVTVGLFFLLSKSQKVQTTTAPVITSIPTVTQTPAVLGSQIKTSGCIVQGSSPDKDCTPGAIFTNVTKDQICVSGYSKTVRNVPDSEKNSVYEEYGIFTHQTGDYEVDHYISLELGGSNDLANLWPEAANPTPGFHEKDKVENYLHQQVCKGLITLQQAQQEISSNWLRVYQQINP